MVKRWRLLSERSGENLSNERGALLATLGTFLLMMRPLV